MSGSQSNRLRNVLVTGASRGIGLGLVKRILQHHPEYRVIATCRKPNVASDLVALGQTYGADRLIVAALDTTQRAEYDSVLSTLTAAGVTALDVLIANAGIASSNRPDFPLDSTGEDMLNVYNTNVVGSVLTMQAFHNLVCAGESKIVMVVSSVLGSIERVTGMGALTSYRASKAALNMVAMTYAENEALRAVGGKVIALHPGWVQTDMGQAGGRKAPVTVEDCTKGTMAIVEAARAVQTGSAIPAGSPYGPFHAKLRSHNCVYVAYDGELLPW